MSHCTWKYVGYFQIPFDIDFWHNSTVIREQTLYHFNTFRPKFLHLVFCPWICSSVSWSIVYGNLSRICILLYTGNCINLNSVELVHSAFQAYCIFLLFCLFILLIFESLILKLQLKILISLPKNIIVIYSETIYNFVLYFPSLP